MNPRNMDDYVDVAERIREFKERYPEGTLQQAYEPRLIHVGEKTFVEFSAYAYRDPTDERPGQGTAWEPVPGPTPFTRDSELQNAETSAWGRAIVALGFDTKKIASAQEVRNRQPEPDPEGNGRQRRDGKITSAQVKRFWVIAREKHITEERVRELLHMIADVGSTKDIPVDKYDEVIEALEQESIPF